ncbi:MAG TPA: putative baseplate assembly protein, partial [Pyrinomonadaceae bacterium]
MENFWIRARLVSGNYGEEARYEAVDKTKPEKGYQFIAATFQPPTITSIKVAFSLTKKSPPEVVLAYNDDLDYKVSAYPFKPFEHKTDFNPTVYFGFSLPTGLKTFPNRKLSLYAALMEFKQGENLVPLSPSRSRRSGKSPDNATSIVTHTFIITNPTSQTVNYLCEATAKSWTPSLKAKEISVEAGTAKELPVLVTIPDAAKEGMSDRGFLTLKLKTDPTIEYDAIFETYVGAIAPASEQLEVDWQYSDGTTWSELSVRDNSENLTRSGLIEFLAPADFNESREFGLTRFWLRAIWRGGEYQFDPRLRGLLLNTTMGTQAVTIRDETLGSSDGSKNQKFQTTRTPILEGQRLEVREPEIPPANEQDKLTADGVKNALRVITDDTGRPREIWVRWSQMPDFYGSGPRDRHYVLDNLTGEVSFGDGQNGLIPPTGAGNIVMSLYRNGGGANGNKPAGTITQLKTTVPYVEKVINHLSAAGGTDAETKDSLLNRAPRTLRHGMRAVTVKDYEDMAMLASTEVARAKCIPLVNVMTDVEGGGGDKKLIRNGTVSLIIVPRSFEAKPSPGSELIRRVQDFVGQQSSPVAELIVTGPKYVGINVTVEVALTSLDGASEV